MNEIVVFKSAKLGYGKRAVLDKLDFVICRGDFWGIVGPNGSGKTTLLRGIMGLLKPGAGEIKRDRNLRFGYCMQRHYVDTIFPFTVFEVVMMARAGLIGPLRRPSKTDTDAVYRSLETAGIRKLSRERFYNLSGGQKQRVLLARALCLEPDFLVLDEPTTDLDIKAEKEILELINSIRIERGLTIALVTHELNEVINSAVKFIFLNKKHPPRILRKDELNSGLLSEVFNTPVKISQIDGRMMIF
jgi:ABC-type Mn2+/Zn2+ transport system ATPase subunit